VAQVAESHQLRKIVADTNWLLDLTSVVDDLTGADAGTVLRPAVPGPAIEAIPTQHANTATVSRLLYGAKAKSLMGRPSGWFFALDDTNDCWYGGPYEMPSDQISIPRNDLVARNVAFAQAAGRWYDGGPALTASAELDRVVALDIDHNSSSIPSGIKLDVGNDRAILLFTKSAEASIRLKSGARQTAVVNLTTSTRLVDIGAVTALHSTGAGRITDATFEVTGMTSGEKLEGWLLLGQYQTID